MYYIWLLGVTMITCEWCWAHCSIKPVLFLWWAIIVDGGQALKHHYSKISFSLFSRYCPMPRAYGWHKLHAFTLHVWPHHQSSPNPELWFNIDLMLRQHCRRWPSIKTTLHQRLVSVGLALSDISHSVFYPLGSAWGPSGSISPAIWVAACFC